MNRHGHQAWLLVGYASRPGESIPRLVTAGIFSEPHPTILRGFGPQGFFEYAVTDAINYHEAQLALKSMLPDMFARDPWLKLLMRDGDL